ncbi:MAG: aminotransferase class IV, partial [Maribacter sp.]
KLNALHQQRNDFDDVLIVKNGLITDACYANILFKIGEELITPKKPLLHGTCRARLLATQTIKEKDIHFTKIAEFDYFQLINAMNDYDSQRWIPVDNIHN